MKTSKASELRKLMKEKGVVRLIGAHDGLSAKIGESAGFDALWASGFEISASYALPDANILTMTEYLHAASVMNDAVKIPVVADCDTGYGNSLNVIQLVKKYEGAGIAAVCMEDKLFPKVNSFIPGRQDLASIAEFVGKILAAKNAQIDPNFMVIARTEALIAGWGMEEALTRCRAYVEAGADGVLIHSKKKTPDEVEEFLSKWDLDVPVWIVPTSYPSLTFDKIKNLKKIKGVIYANQGLRSAVAAMEKNLKEIIETGSVVSLEDKMATMAHVFELQDMPKLKDNEKRFVKTDNGDSSAVILAAGDHKREDLMSTVLRETPLVLLDIHGKSILDRNLEMLNRNNVREVKLVTGYRGEKITHAGVTKVVNDKYKESGSLFSLMKGLENSSGRVVAIFGDTLFDKEVLHRLLESKKDIVIVVDRAFTNRTGVSKKSNPDLVQCESNPVREIHTIRPDRDNAVLKIGKSLSAQDAHYQFTGMLLLSAKGLETVRKEYAAAEKKYGAEKSFYEAKSFLQAGVTDFIQHIVDQGHAVHTLEIYGGWREIQTFHDYQAVCHNFAQTGETASEVPSESSSRATKRVSS